MKKAVLSAEPSIISRKLKSQDLFLIFASDGLWEHLSDEAAVDIVYNNPRSVSHLFLIIILIYIIINGNEKCLVTGDSKKTSRGSDT